MSDKHLEQTRHICRPGKSWPKLRLVLLAESLGLTHDCAFQRKHHPPNKELSMNGAARIRSAHSQSGKHSAGA